MKRLFLIGSITVFVLVVLGVLVVSRMQLFGRSSGPVSSGTINVREFAGGLEHPWDVAVLPRERILFTERAGTLNVVENGQVKQLYAPEKISSSGEGGMLGLAADESFPTNGYVFVCYNRSADEVVVERLTLNTESLSVRSSEIIISEIPATASGRHSGCQLESGSDGALWLGTGDSADESTPQDRSSLGGKILRVTRDGDPFDGNPAGPDDRIFSYGHRNTQGIALYEEPINGSYGVSAEHGPGQDDEINSLVTGNFGWAPGAGYDESVPMTDNERFPGAIESLWSSGNSTIAVSGATFLTGEAWKEKEGWLAVGVLKDRHILLLEFDGNEIGKAEHRLLESEHGRIRGVVSTNGSLYVTTDNGIDDKILKVSPR